MPDTKRKKTRGSSNAILPLPSFIRASAQDQAGMQMRAAGRSAWSEDDYDLACQTLERLIRSCYGRDGEGADDKHCYIRFSVAERMQRAGQFRLDSDFTAVSAQIDRLLADAMVAP